MLLKAQIDEKAIHALSGFGSIMCLDAILMVLREAVKEFRFEVMPPHPFARFDV